MKLVVGLGNPGEKYQGVRHNLGFMVVGALVKKLLPVKKSENFFQYDQWLESEVGLIQKDVLLVKPQTYMNNSGRAVDLLSARFKFKTADLIIIHDELDLPLGKIKVKIGGSGAGHNGVESIIKTMGTDQFIRVRLGIGNLKSHSGEHKRISFDADKFVLEPFTGGEKSKVKHLIKRGVWAIELLLKEGLEKAQNQFN